MTASGGGRQPWWRSPGKLAAVAGLVVVGVVLAIVLTNRSTSHTVQSAEQVALQPVGATGQDPFTGSVAANQASPSASVPTSATASGGTRNGGDVGLYGGTRNVSSCDVPKLAAFLNANADKARAWATVEGISTADITGYLNGLTPVVLRADTRVTNHGFHNGVATPYQAVLQAGTAVLVDARGVPRARCACGNPLLAPTSTTNSTFTGTAWSSFRDRDVVVVTPAPTVVNIIVLVDESTGGVFGRPVGTTGATDTTVAPSASASGSNSSSSSGSASGSPSPSSSTSHSQSGSSSGSPSGSGSGSPSGPASKGTSHTAGSASAPTLP